MKKFLVIPLFSLLLVSCFEDMDDVIQPCSTLEIQDFVYKGLNVFYLYKSQVPELDDKAFASQTELNGFLSNYATPEDLFNYLLVEEDRFSFIINDYQKLEASLQGVSLHNGMEFGLVQIQETGDIFGYVRYVLPQTSAAANGVKRGMIFNGIDGQIFNENNYNGLLSQTTYTINLATLNGSDLTSTGESITLVKEQYAENPVHIQKTFEIDGQKIGYLMYNAFTSSYDNELNAVFANFKGEGITDLILDLRYNGGGSIETANDLSSMITGQFNGQLFIKQVYNENFPDEERLFNNKINSGEMIASLNLNRVYVLTTGSTASASELILSGLMPYIDVVQIGTTTTGKYQGSVLIYDSSDFTKKDINLCHRYAMLPLILKSVNSAGFTDYANGIAPDVELQEDFSNLGELGQTDEPLLNAALNEIIPGFGSGGKPATLPFEFRNLGESGMNSPLHQRMMVEEIHKDSFK